MVDLAKLGIQVDSTQVKSTNKDLDTLAGKSAKTEKKVKKLGKTSKKAGKEVGGLQAELRKTASSIAVIDGPLGGVASRFNAFATLLGRITPEMIAFTAATIALSAATKSAITDFIPYEKSINQIDAVLAATGRTAEITTKQFDTFAKELGDATLTSRQAILDIVPAISTFQSIATRDLRRVISLGQDLSQIFGGDLRSNTLLLARALERPGEAFTVLQRKGVSFTESEKELLKSLQETGQIAEAQAIIFRKLAKIEGTAENSTRGLAAATDSLSEGFTNFNVAFAKTSGVAASFENSIKFLTKTFKFFEENIDSVVTTIDVLATFIISRVIVGVIGLTRRVIGFSLAARTATTSTVGLTAAMVRLRAASLFFGGPLGIALFAAGTAFVALTDDIEDNEDAIQKHKDTVGRLKDIYGDLKTAVGATREELTVQKNAILETAQANLKLAKAQLVALETFPLLSIVKAEDAINVELQKNIKLQKQRIALLEQQLPQKIAASQGVVLGVDTGAGGQKIDRLSEKVQAFIDGTELGLAQLDDFTIRTSESLADALVSPWEKGETAADKFRSFVSGVLNDVARQIARQAVAQSFTPLFSSALSTLGSFAFFAKGGVVNSPTAFGMEGGRTGVAGEAGPEGILPLKRTSSGDLGVQVAGGSGTGGGGLVNNIVINITNSKPASDEENQNLARAMQRKLQEALQQNNSKFIQDNLRPRGILNGGIPV